MVFNIYMKALGEIQEMWATVSVVQWWYAVISCCTKQDYKKTVEPLNWCLETLMGWTRANKLRLNPNKMKVLLPRSNSSLASGITSCCMGLHSLWKLMLTVWGYSWIHCWMLRQWQRSGWNTYCQVQFVRQLCPFLEKKNLAMVM